MRLEASYPTIEHERAAEAATDFFARQSGVDAVLLIASCARGRATRESCVDIAVLVPPELERADLERRWLQFYRSADVFKELLRIGAYSHVDLDIIDGHFEPGPHGWTSGPDAFELEIGNFVAYSLPLWQGNDRFTRLRAQWLPYYDESLCHERFAQAVRFCRNNLDHIPMYVRRELYFQAFDRLYNAYREFLQALFIARRTYPIAYDKWIREQIEELLGLPELYRRLPTLFEISQFESDEIARKGKELERLLDAYL